VAPSEREYLAPGIRYLDDFKAIEAKTEMEPWQAEMYKEFGFEQGQ
jgi:hypothetical protein